MSNITWESAKNINGSDKMLKLGTPQKRLLREEDFAFLNDQI